VKTVFVKGTYAIRLVGVVDVYSLDETWVNQNCTRERSWKMSDGLEGVNIPVGEGGRFIISHAGSADGVSFRKVN
jgi:hypothetical protein